MSNPEQALSGRVGRRTVVHNVVRRLALALLMPASMMVSGLAQAGDPLAALKAFSSGVKGGRADFAQTVTSADGTRQRKSSGTFEFARPDRFRFAYLKPDEQVIVGDGKQVWLWDKDLNQVQQRPLAQALGATPAALLAGGDVERDFTLTALPSKDGLDWVQAVPKAPAGAAAAGIPLKQVEIGFRDAVLAQLVITDAFGQRSQLVFSNVDTRQSPPAEMFRFVVPKGADVLRP